MWMVRPRVIWVTCKWLSGSYCVWIGLQVYVGGRAVIEEITLRTTEVATQFSTFGAKQYHAMLAFYQLSQALLKLLAPFFFDLFFVLKTAWGRLPHEFQIATLGASAVAYCLYSFRWARHVAFLPSAAGIWLLSEQLEVPEELYVYYFLPVLSQVIPVLSSLSAFATRRNSPCRQWLHYWALSPLTVYAVAAWRERSIEGLGAAGGAFRSATSSGVGFSAGMGVGDTTTTSSTSVLYQAWHGRPLSLFLVYLVFWHGADIVFHFLYEVLINRIATAALRNEFLQKLLRTLSDVALWVLPASIAPRRKPQESSSAIVGDHGTGGSSTSSGRAGENGGSPERASSFLASLFGGGMRQSWRMFEIATNAAGAGKSIQSEVLAAVEEEKRAVENASSSSKSTTTGACAEGSFGDSSSSSASSTGGSTLKSDTSSAASGSTTDGNKTSSSSEPETVLRLVWRVAVRLASQNSKTLLYASSAIVAVVAAAYYVYRFLSFVSKAVVWAWFFFELTNEQAIARPRKKLATALLFLSAQKLFSQRWFLIPDFLLDLFRIPLLLVFNMFGEIILDKLLMTSFGDSGTPTPRKVLSKIFQSGVAGSRGSTSDSSPDISPRGEHGDPVRGELDIDGENASRARQDDETKAEAHEGDDGNAGEEFEMVG
ncbi:unnamed protein product [Amoebophrya sp. A25]|nr:unnamed protein product [Amoebophrya sp. A25]|eukprot:GSA25T00010515001.1